MTTNHHTPIAFGANAASSVVNAPLSDLDEAISNIISGAIVLSALQVRKTAGVAGWGLRIDSNGVSNESGVFFDASNNAEFAGRNGSGTLNVSLKTSGTSFLNGGNVGIGTDAPAERLHLYSSGTGAVNLLIGNADTGAAATDGFRVGITSSEIAILMNYENTNMEFGTNNVVRMVISAAGVVRTVGEIEIDGDLNHDGSNVGFYGSAPVAKPTVTGSRGGNAALASLLTALANLGLITDNST